MRLDFDSYSVDVSRETVEVFLGDRRYAILRVSSPLNTSEGMDIDDTLPEPDYMRYEDGVNMNWSATSNLWSRKTYSWHFENDLFWCQIKVKGEGVIHDLHYFEGSYPDFVEVYADRCEDSDQPCRINASPSGPMNPPLCYCLGFEDGPWLGGGVAPEKGKCDFSLFEYVPGVDTFCFRVEYTEQAEANGSWTSPFFIFRPGRDKHDALRKYCDILEAWEMA